MYATLYTDKNMYLLRPFPKRTVAAFITFSLQTQWSCLCKASVSIQNTALLRGVSASGKCLKAAKQACVHQW